MKTDVERQQIERGYRGNSLVYQYLTATKEADQISALKGLVSYCSAIIKREKLYLPGPDVEIAEGGTLPLKEGFVREYRGSPRDRMEWLIREKILRYLFTHRGLSLAQVELMALDRKFQTIVNSVKCDVLNEIEHLNRKAATIEIPGCESALDTDERRAAWRRLPGGLKSFTRVDAAVLCPIPNFEVWFEKLLDLKMVVPLGRDQDPGRERYYKRSLQTPPEISRLDVPE